jgi:mono/diheme cytochrome c family protein
MRSEKTQWSWAAAVLLIFLFPVATLAKPSDPAKTATQESDQQKDKKSKPADDVAPQESDYRKTDPSQYVGSDTCKGCHEDVGKSFDRGPHWKTNLAKYQGPQWQGCEACHGPGKEHAESADPSKIVRFPSLTREEASRRCLGCHEFGEEHANFLRAQHLKTNVGCVDCHSIHHPLVERKLLRAAQPQLYPEDDPAALYKSKCQVCHGAEGKGDTPAGQKMGAKDFHSPEVARMSDAQLIEAIKKGKGKMTGYEGKLTDDQIKALVKYIRSLK